ncbi:MAG: hypothetical protein ACFBSE_24005 [Prochloraceae cyanobacterium]
MGQQSQIYCFRADYDLSKEFDRTSVPDWLSIDVNWRGYKISTLPWIADVAKVLDLLPIEEDSPEAWIIYLESLGLRGIESVCCEVMFKDKLYC